LRFAVIKCQYESYTTNLSALATTLFIDGSNLFGGMTDLLSVGQYFQFQDLLEVMYEDFTIDQVEFYGTYMQIDQSKSALQAKRVRAQKAFFDSSKACEAVTFHKGHFSGSGKEKGVDVQLAVDMVVAACTGAVDEAIIMTGDADLKYAVQTSVRFSVPVHIAAIASPYPFGMAPLASRIIVYDLDSYFASRTPKRLSGSHRSIMVRPLDDRLTIHTIEDIKTRRSPPGK
jgi:uncharacterized LabA/DUF88 family protein